MSAIPARRLLCLSSVVIASVLCGCYPSGEGPEGVVEPAFDTWENEPNNDSKTPDPIGSIAVGEGEIIGGYITDVGTDDFDGFAFQSVEPCTIEFSLIPQSEFTDLDLCVFDPVLGAFTVCFQDSGHVEKGTFELPVGGIEFHMVVSAFHGSSEYRLEVRCTPPPPSPLTAPGASPEKIERARELERYFTTPDQDAADEPHVIARGAYLEVDVEHGLVREAPLEVRAGSN